MTGISIILVNDHIDFLRKPSKFESRCYTYFQSFPQRQTDIIRKTVYKTMKVKIIYHQIG